MVLVFLLLLLFGGFVIYLHGFVGALLLGLLFTAPLYGLVDFFLWLGLKRLHARRPSNEPNATLKPSISILVCARNEEKNLPQCLDALLAQDYEGDWEIWVANDRSTDSTSAILKSYSSQYPSRVHFIEIAQLPEVGLSPKKFAIQCLVEKSQADLLLLTDADCTMGPKWASSMANSFGSHKEWVSGYSFFPSQGIHKSLLNGLQALDFQSHRTVDAAGVALGFPITACGQNLAYRRSLFMELGGFTGVDKILSGDDDLLMHKLARHRPHAIHYNTDPDSFVCSQGATTWKGAWEQRKRWASKTVHYPPATFLFLLLVFLWFVLLFVGPWIGLTYYLHSHDLTLLGFIILAFLWKMAWDYFVMRAGASLFHSKHTLKWFLPMSFLQIPMIVGAVFWGIAGRFRWKA